MIFDSKLVENKTTIFFYKKITFLIEKDKKNSMDEENVFELEDYTTSGELEKFTSQIEDAIQEWELNSLTR